MNVFIQHVWYGSDFEQHRGCLNVFSLENKVAKVCRTLYQNKRSSSPSWQCAAADDDDDDHAVNFDW